VRNVAQATTAALKIQLNFSLLTRTDEQKDSAAASRIAASPP
jgi:hypothetical protein